MSILNSGQWEAPFWGATRSFITGQDMLGMQNTSIATYSTLLPGLTNLTRRIRYYGFYMWMLEQYAKTKGKVSVSEFQCFMRRGELILAFVMAHSHSEELGVVGSLYARHQLQKDLDPINIAAGADLENTDIYWQYSLGAFGQYYQGALSAMGLITPNERENRIFICTPNYGKTLAELFESTITEATRYLYLKAIDQGEVTRKELIIFGKEFSVNAIDPNSKEWAFYMNMLFGKDLPIASIAAGHTKFRVETILLYMEYISNTNQYEAAGSFPRSFHYGLWDRGPFIGFTACTGWHYYSLNEFAHYSLETILWACLVQLRNQGPVLLPNFIEEFTACTVEAMKTTLSGRDEQQQLTFSVFAEDLYSNGFNPASYTDAIQQTGEHKPFEAVVYALQVLAQIYKRDIESNSKLDTYAKKHGMYREGDVTELLLWLNKNENLTIPEFVRKLVLQLVLNRHIEVSMRKMRNRNDNTLKFILEDNILKPVAIVKPVWTGPRLHSLHQFLIDLKLVQNNSLTALGKEMFKAKLL